MDETHLQRRFTISHTAFGAILVLLLGAVFGVRHLIPPHDKSLDPTVVISEFEAANGSGLRDEDGDHSDWIELCNAGRVPVNMDGWYLTDTFHKLSRWRFPSVELPPGGYLVVFASGKDRRRAGHELHTNFRLNERGEYLALVKPDGQSIAHDFFPKYPRQRPNISYGLNRVETATGVESITTPQNYCYFQTPTPGDVNRGDLIGLVATVGFSRESGFCHAPFKLRLTTETMGATIYYTTNGDLPNEDAGIRYEHPIPISSTTVLRATAIKSGFAAANVEGRTYLFPNDVLAQTGTNFPETWGEREQQPIPAYYRMSKTVVDDPGDRATLLEGLKSLLSISIVTEQKNLFDPVTGIYTHPMENGAGWERPASIELIDPTGHGNFHINCGLRIQGGWSRRPEESPKHSLRLVFKKEYGATKLNLPLFGPDGAQSFDTLILRGGNNNSWLHWNSDERRRADYVRDEWMRRSMLEMGHPSARGIFVHVYLNGLYWGMYNLCERPAAPFVAANEGGSRRDYDAMNSDKMLSGNRDAWNRMMALVNSGVHDTNAYAAVQQCVDLPELADFFILNYYGGNGDWDRASNWYAACRRRPAGKFQFFVWDGERTLEGIDDDTLDFDDDESPPRLFHKLSENAEFRMLFADHVQTLLFHSGVLTPERAARRYRDLAAKIEDAVVAESARWGNYRFDIQRYKVGPFERYTRREHWQPEVDRLVTQYFPRRPAAILKEFRAHGLYPEIAAPDGHRDGNNIVLTDADAPILFTTDGSDPRLAGGATSTNAHAYAGPVKIARDQKLIARAHSDTQWSARMEF